MFDTENQKPFHKLIDNIKNIARARGADKPSWSDVWLGVTSTLEFARVLSDRGVSSSGFATEIRYISQFKKNDELQTSNQPSKELLQRAITDLSNEITSFTNLKDAYDEDVRIALKVLEANVTSKLAALHIHTEADEELLELSQVKARVLRHVAQHAIEAYLKKMFIGFGDPSMAGMTPGSGEDVKEEIAKQISMQLQDTVLPELFIGGLHEDPEQDVIAELEQLESNPLSTPSPVEVVDFIENNSGYVFENLLYRNGLRTSDPDREDQLAEILPSYTMQSLMLSALEEAYRLNSKKLTSRHLVLALFQNSEIRIHFAKLGIKDLMQFEDDFRKHSVGMDEKPKGRISVHPEITDEFRELAQQLDEVFKKSARTCEVLRALVKSDENIDKALNKAGLRRRMLRSWRSTYEKPEKKDNNEQDPEKKKAGFQVPDIALEELIGEYCTDQTALARQKKFDPMIGNESLVDQMTTKLLKRGKKNPIIIGEPGVGKTKVLEGLAQAIVKGDVPEELVGARLLMLDLSQMNDTPYIGVFESRILPIIKGIAERNAEGSQPRVLLGIDEFAAVQKAGGHSFSPGFRGLIKPYLTSGDIFMIAATTDEEYRTEVEQDPALARRLQPIFMQEPTVKETAQILLGLKLKYSQHHKLRIPNALMHEIAEIAGRYIHTVKQPDKAIDLFDEACALARKTGEKTLKREHVVASVSSKTNIPEEFLSQDDNERYAEIEENVRRRVLGQEEAIQRTSAALVRAKAGFGDEHTPVGNFLFVGPTGVGKTELAKALAEFLFGDDDEFLVRFDMSEFQDASSVNRFIGSSPGYVAYEQGGLLVKAVRSKPFAVYLYDEVEKAHADVFNALLAPFSDGTVTDGRGVSADMRHTINIMTSNLGAKDVMAEAKRRGIDPLKDHEAWQKMAKPIYEQAVQQFFAPEFLNRLDGVVYFNPLSPQVIRQLIKRRFNQTASQLKDNHGLALELDREFELAAQTQGFDVRYGARPLKRAWQDIVETPMAAWLLRQKRTNIVRARTLVMRAKSNVTDEQDNQPSPVVVSISEKRPVSTRADTSDAVFELKR